MRERCIKCPAIAVWMYVPNPDRGYFCDKCVPRGCSCNIVTDGYDYMDDQGRSLPCLEYDYDALGFEEETE